MKREFKGLLIIIRDKVIDQILIYGFFLVLTIPPGISRSEVDCSALDPRVSISKEKEGQITGSIDTLYKIAKAGGSIQGRIKEEIQNLQQGAATDEKMQIKLRALYLYCGMVANAPEITVEKKISLYNLMLSEKHDEKTPESLASTTSAEDFQRKSKEVDKPKSTPLVAASEEPKRTVLFKETFNKPGFLPATQFPNSGRTIYQDGWYVLQNTTDSMAFFYRITAVSLPSSVRIEIDMRLNDGPLGRPFGLLLGASDAKFNNSYGVLIRGDGATEIIRWIDNKYYMELYLPPREQINTGYGSINSLTVEINDMILTYFVNGVKIGSYKSTNRIQGYIGFYTGYPGLDVGFRNLIVSQ